MKPQDEWQKKVRRILMDPDGRAALKQYGIDVEITDEEKEKEKPIVAILCPTYRAPEPVMQDSLRAMVLYSRERGITVYSGAPIQTSVVHWSRNFIVADQIKSGKPWTHVLMVDDDMKIPEDALVKLLAHQKDIIGGICTRRTDPPRPTISHYNDEKQVFEPIWEWPDNETFEVGGIGAAFLLVSRNALEQIAQAYFDCLWEKDFYKVSDEWVERVRAQRLQYFDKEKMAFWFRFLPSESLAIEQGEDMSFCLVARKYCGLSIWVDTSVQPGHLGTYDFGVKDFIPYRHEVIERAKRDGTYKPKAVPPMDISILCPTRGRPENVKRLLDSIAATSSVLPEVIFYVDDDDTTFPGALGYPNASVVRGPRITLSDCWNKLAAIATGEILMNAGDDLIFKTKGWDDEVKQSFANFPDRLVFVHGDDGHFGRRFGTHGFVHRKWVEAVGYFIPPYFSSDFGDTWLNEVANRLDRRVALPFLAEHMHPIWNKAEWDQTHKERLARHERDQVEELYKKLAPERDRDVEKLSRIIHGESLPTRQPELVVI